jgi:hypothetical protein
MKPMKKPTKNQLTIKKFKKQKNLQKTPSKNLLKPDISARGLLNSI